MSEDAGAADHETGFAEIQETLQRMRSSSRAAVPMMLLGLALTLAAAGVAIYYITTLRSSNQQLQEALESSGAALSQSQRAQSSASSLLRQAMQANPADRAKIALALNELSQGAETLASAADDLQEAQEQLPTAGISPEAPATVTPANTATAEAETPAAAAAPAAPLPAVVPGRFFAVLASFSEGEDGHHKALERAALHRGQGHCAEIWFANSSRHFAVVSGSVASEDDARARARAARTEGYATDAYAQFDRGWTRIPDSPRCPG